MSARDMYADLEKIEARGKRKKEKSKGLFSSFGRKDEPEPEPQPKAAEAPPEATPAPEPVFVKPVPAPQPVAEAPRPVPQPAQPREAPAPNPVEDSWKPLTGGKLKKAEEELVAYKKWLNHGFKSGVLTKQQCVDMVRKKEMELGLRAPQ